jgi:tetratricopeptide (TPR) repeat protein
MDTTNELELSVDVEVPEVEPESPLEDEAPVVPAEIAALAAQLRAGRCVLCAGPRLSLGGLGLREVVAQLLGELPDAEAHDAWPLLESRPLAAAGFARRRLGDGFVAALESAAAVEGEPSEAMRLLGALPFRAAVTTALDDLFERAFFADGATPLVYTPKSAGSLLRDGKLRFVWKVLGDARAAETVIASSEELRALLADPDYRAAAAELFRTRTILFAGFDARDWDLQLLLEQVLAGAPKGGEHYALLGGALSAIEREDLWEAYGIRVLEGDDAAGLGRALHAALAVEPEVPADDDWQAWLGRHAEEPERAGERLDAISAELRERGDLEPLMELLLGRVGVETEAARRAELLRQVARTFEHELDDAERALTALTASLAEEPASAEWHELERLAERAGAWGTLEEDLGETLPQLPSSVRARLFRKWEKWSALAETLDERAGEVGPVEARALRREVAALWAEKLGEPAEAVARYQTLYAQAPELDILIALEPLVEGTPAEAENLARQAELAATDLERAALYRRLARLSGDGPDAEAWWETLLAVDADAEDALRALGPLYRRAHKWPELIEALRRRAARAGTGEQAEIFLEIGRLYATELNDRERAAEAWRAAESLAPPTEAAHGDALAALCAMAEAEGTGEEARALYDRRAALCEGTEDELLLTFRAAELSVEPLGDFAGAAARLSRVLRRDGKHLKALYLAGIADEKLGEPDRALGHFLALLALEPGHLTASARAAELLWQAGRHAELLPILERLAQSAGRGPLLVERLVRLGRAAAALDDEAKSAQAFARAVEMDPLHVPALRGHVAHLLSRDAWAEARPLLERILEMAELSPGERLELLEEAARCELKLGSLARARALVSEALSIHPTHRSSLLMRVELEREEPEGLIAAKRALLAGATPDEKSRLWSEIGDLYLQRLGDGTSALGAWNEALALVPDDHKLLHKILDVEVEARNWAEARDVLERLIEAESDASIRAKYRLTVALICRDELGRQEASAAHLRAALEDDPDNARASEALERMLLSSEEWKELARHYRRQLKRLGADTPRDDGRHDELLRLWTALSEVCDEKLGEPEGAVAALEVALSLDPDDYDADKRLADLYVRAGQPYFDRSIAAHQRILRREKGRIHSYRALKHLYIQTQQRDKSLACSGALHLLHQAEKDDVAKIARWRKQPFPTARRQLGDDGWARLTHPDEDRLLDQLFALVGPTLAAGMAQPPKALGINPKELIAVEDPRSFAKALVYVSDVLDVPRPQIYARPAQREAVEFVNCLGSGHLEPVLLLGAPLVGERRSEMEQVFELSRKLALLVPERILRLAMPHPDQIARVIQTAMALGEGDSDDAEVARLVTGLKRALPAPLFEQAAAGGQLLRERNIDPDAAARAWLVATDLTSLRVGWAMVGDVEVCGRLVAAEGQQPGALPPTQRLLDLVWSTTTEDVLTARRQLAFA